MRMNRFHKSFLFRFKKIISDGLAGISSVFSSKKLSSSSLGVDIGSSSIKVVQLKKKNGILATLIMFPLVKVIYW